MNELNYALTQEEVQAAIKLTGRIKQRLMLCGGHTVLALIAIVLVSYRLYHNHTQILMYVLLGLSIGVLLYTWLRLRVELSRVVLESTSRPATVKFLGTKISFCFIDSDCTIVDMRDKPQMLENEELFVIVTSLRGMIVLPKKHLDDEMIEFLKKNKFDDELIEAEEVVLIDDSSENEIQDDNAEKSVQADDVENTEDESAKEVAEKSGDDETVETDDKKTDADENLESGDESEGEE